jgi:hypothetical protein
MALGPGVRRACRLAALGVLCVSVLAAVLTARRVGMPLCDLGHQAAPIVLFVFLNGMAVVWVLAFVGFPPRARGVGCLGLVLNCLAVAAADVLAMVGREMLDALAGSRNEVEAAAAWLAAFAVGSAILVLMAFSLLMNALLLWWLARTVRRGRELANVN